MISLSGVGVGWNIGENSLSFASCSELYSIFSLNVFVLSNKECDICLTIVVVSFKPGKLLT